MIISSLPNAKAASYSIQRARSLSKLPYKEYDLLLLRYYVNGQ